jgi:nicotinate-nucleotide pyrophosphorylase (carboxylating)
VCAGTYLLQPIFFRLDPSMRISVELADGAHLTPGAEICRLDGSIRAILASERTALNFLQRLSGIATRTARMAALCAGTGAQLLDTRKTTPGLRILEKKAVVAGGGRNHRFGLYDMILIKDTHVAAAGGPAAAVRSARTHAGGGPAIKIEVEVQSFEQFREAVAERPDRIMLDNMNCSEMARCVQHLRGAGLRIETEASGNVTEATIAEIARTGVDFISSGAITHSAPALDIHLIIV